MNTLTQQQINQYQWRVADGVTRIVNPYRCESMGNYKCYELPECPWCQGCIKEDEFENELGKVQYHTNAPDGIYSGEAFELTYRLKAKEQYVNQDGFSQYRAWIFISKGQFDYASDRFYDVQAYLRLKPSHLPAVLTTQPGEEWKDRYNEVWLESFNGGAFRKKPPISMRYFKDFDVYVKSLGTAFKAKREWHLNTPPAEQEAETPIDVLKRTNYIVPADEANCVAETVLHDEVGMVTYAMQEYAKGVTQQLQSTLTQKYQRIAELEMDAEHVKRCLSDYTKMCQKKLEEAHVNPLTNFIYKECIDLMRNLKNSINRKNGLNI